ncbi:MAG: 6-carboxytetrahydropterin synthase [Aureispira sp.]|nr:6-carboxytetrahydropterin synthase [Aureispira sp.]
MLVYLTRKEGFNAAHKLWVKSWTEEQNFELFGKCANKNFHGHNYEYEVTVKGKPDPLTGLIMNVKDLGKIMKVKVSDVLDHTNLNLDPNFLPEDAQPTIENLVYYIWKEIEPELPESCELHCVKLRETAKSYAEYYGE